MTRVLLQVQIEKRVETSAALSKMVTEKGRSFLGNIINICEIAHFRNKYSVQAMAGKGKSCFTKEKVQASPMK
jgi:hypothetical protein